MVRNAEHLADDIRRVDVPGSRSAYDLVGCQFRYPSIEPKRAGIKTKLLTLTQAGG